MTYDTLTYAGSEYSLGWLGFDLSSCMGLRLVMATDTWEGTVVTGNAQTSPQFAFESSVLIQSGRVSADGTPNSFSGGVKKFTGIRIANPIQVSADGQMLRWRFEGPWYDLGKTPYQQKFVGVGGGLYPLSEVVLFTTSNYTGSNTGLCTVGDQLQAILQWLLDQYAAQGFPAPFQYTGRLLNAGKIDLTQTGLVLNNGKLTGGTYVYGLATNPTIDPSFFTLQYPSYICRPMMCDAALKKCLELSPRCNIGFDYSTSPPTIYIKIIDNFPAVTLPVSDSVSAVSTRITSREDLQARAVLITYRINNTVNGQPVVDYLEDLWGPHGSNSPLDPKSGRRVVADFIDLQGISLTTENGYLDCEPLTVPASSSQAFKRAWWSSRRGGEHAFLIDSRYRFPTMAIPDATMTYATTDATTGRIAGNPVSNADIALLTNRIVGGAFHPWMVLGSPPNNVPVQAVKVRVSTKLLYDQYNVVAAGDTIGQLPADESASNADTSGSRIGSSNGRDINVDFWITNGITGSYSTFATETSGETAIIGAGGIAQYLFNALGVLQYEGGYTKVDVKFDNSISVLQRLNLSGGQPGWTTMNAQIQSVRENYGTHTTEVEIGLSKHLSAGQLSSYFNMWNLRRNWFNPAIKTNNSAGSGNVVDMAQATPQANSTLGAGDFSRGATTAYTTPTDPTTVILGQHNQDANLIASILAGHTTVTPFSPDTTTTIKVIQPRETLVCDASGNQFYAIVMRTGYYNFT